MRGRATPVYKDATVQRRHLIVEMPAEKRKDALLAENLEEALETPAGTSPKVPNEPRGAQAALSMRWSCGAVRRRTRQARAPASSLRKSATAAAG